MRPCLVNSPFLSSYAKIQAQSALRVGFLVSILLSSFTASGETEGWGGIIMSSSSITMISLPMLLLSKGQKPQNILKSITPSDHMSAVMEYLSPFKTSGAMQMGEPSMVMDISSSLQRGLQPKSLSLTTPSCMSRFSGFRSRCKKLWRLSTRKASTIWKKQVRAVDSGRAPFSLSSFSRVPPLQYSQTKQKLLTVLSKSQTLMMWGQPSRLLRMLISLQVPSSSLGNCLNFSALTTLMATSCLVLMLMARQTVECMPCQILLCNEQFSIFFPIPKEDVSD